MKLEVDEKYNKYRNKNLDEITSSLYTLKRGLENWKITLRKNHWGGEKRYERAVKRHGEYIEKLQNTSNQFLKSQELMEEKQYSKGWLIIFKNQRNMSPQFEDLLWEARWINENKSTTIVCDQTTEHCKNY